MSTEIQTRETNVPALHNWGAPEELGSENILIPRILLMQPQSPQVDDKNVFYGQLLDSVTNEVLGGADKPLDIVPISFFQQWRVEKLDGKQFKLDHFEPYTNQNKSRLTQWTDNGVDYKAFHCLSFYVLTINDLVNGLDLPKTITFKSSSARTGKAIFTQMFILNKAQKLSPAGTMIRISVEKVTAANKYAVMKMAPIGKTEEEAVMKAKRWYEVINAGQTKIDESADEAVEA